MKRTITALIHFIRNISHRHYYSNNIYLYILFSDMYLFSKQQYYISKNENLLTRFISNVI
nr:CPPV052 G-protein-coupled receptor family protein [Cooks petrelpox virus]